VSRGRILSALLAADEILEDGLAHQIGRHQALRSSEKTYMKYAPSAITFVPARMPHGTDLGRHAVTGALGPKKNWKFAVTDEGASCEK
jgi:hypothetical protein